MWLGAVALGMVLRALTGQTVVVPFVIVALLSLGVFLLGYRLIVAGFRRLAGAGSAAEAPRCTRLATHSNACRFRNGAPDPKGQE